MNKFTTVLALISMVAITTGCATNGGADKMKMTADQANPYQVRSNTELTVEQLPPAGYTPLK